MGVHKRYKKGINYIKDDKYIAEFRINEHAAEKLSESTLATTFGDCKYKIGLEFVIEDNIYIQKIPKNSTYLFTLSFSGAKFGVITINGGYGGYQPPWDADLTVVYPSYNIIYYFGVMSIPNISYIIFFVENSQELYIFIHIIIFGSQIWCS